MYGIIPCTLKEGAGRHAQIRKAKNSPYSLRAGNASQLPTVSQAARAIQEHFRS